MRVFFSFDYKGNNAYLGLKAQPLMMDMEVTNIDGLLTFLELRLGLHTVSKSENDRLVGYYKCVREYMKVHKDEADNQLYDSYTVSPLATSREMLKWRDALAVCGWNKNTPAQSRRLKVLQGVEQLFPSEDYPDMSIRLRGIIERLQQKKGMMHDVTFVMPFNPELLHPVLRQIITLAEADGAQAEQLALPDPTGDNNLSRLKQLLTSDTAESMTLDEGDDTVSIWQFKDDMEAAEYLAMLADNAFDVIIQPDNKLTDNFLHSMGKPVAGSAVANSAPQIIQLFFTGVGMMARPLNIVTLLQWLYAPIHPLPGNFRYRLAERLASSGGWLPDPEERGGSNCCQLVEDWISGKAEKDNGNPIDKKEEESRRFKASVFLPDFKGGSEDTLTAKKLHTFLTELSAWGRQRSAIIAQEDQHDQRISQLNRLSELCDTLKNLTDDIHDDDKVAYSEIEKHIACLYEPSEFVQYQPQATSRFTVSSPGQIAANAGRLLWAGLHDFEPMVPATDFLTPTEQESLKDHLMLWDKNDVRKLQQQTLLLPLLFCQQQLTLVTVDTAGSKTVTKHPLIVRIEQQVKNHAKLTVKPEIEAGCYVPVEAMTNNAASGTTGNYTTISRTDLIKWKKHESPTSIEKLIQNPLDYTLESIAYISDNGQSDLGKINMTKGNVAHAVIQQLFYVPEDKDSGYAAKIRQRVEAGYKQVFDKVVETKGAVLLLQENSIERRQLFEQLRECIDHLIDIIEADNLHVTACEQPLNGYPFGKPDDKTPDMVGYADMILARENGQHIIFDFKWTSSKSYYQGLLQKNRSSQLAIYASMLSELTDDRTLPTAYFLMPRGRLYSTEQFKSFWTDVINVEEGCEGDIISQIVNSYRYRREEIMSGRIEMGEGQPLEELDYFNDTESCNLFPLKPDYDNATVKETNGYSNYTNLKN